MGSLVRGSYSQLNGANVGDTVGPMVGMETLEGAGVGGVVSVGELVLPENTVGAGE